MKPKHLILTFLAVLFLGTRLTNLMAFPMFLDEAIYFRWVETIKHNPYQWLLPLKEFGWAPLTTWIATLISQIVGNSLLALRLTSVIFGGLSLWVAYKLSSKYSSWQAASLYLLLIITSPIILIHDRLGLRGDSAVTFFTLLTFYGLADRLIGNRKKSVYLIALALFFGLLTKSTAWLLPPMVILAYLFFRPKLSRHDLLALLIPSLVLVFLQLTQTLSLFFGKSDVFLLSFLEASKLIKPNFIQLSQWSFQYLTWPILIAIIIGAGIALKTKIKFWQLLTIMTIPAILFVLFFAKILFPRYLLATVTISLLAAVCTLAWLLKKLPGYLNTLLLIVVFLPSVFIDHAIIRDIKSANLPEIEKWQYITGWPSGFSTENLATYLKSDYPEVLITESNDLITSSLNYYWPDHQIKLLKLDEAYLLNTPLPQDKKTYLVVNVADSLPSSFSANLIQEFPRPDNKSSIKIFEVTNLEY
jgi:hypothetical protein